MKFMKVFSIAVFALLAQAQSITFPPTVQGVNAQYRGQAGGSTARYYWVQPIYPYGRGAISNYSTVTTIATLSAQDFVQVSWNSAPGAIGYDVLRTTSSTTPTGACNCAVIQRTTANTARDQGASLQNYTVATTNTLPSGSISPTTVTPTGLNFTATARTATADGTGTGTIAAGVSFVVVTSSSADNIIVLPAPTPGTVVILTVGANGYELRSSAPATVAINGGTGTDAESAIPANSTVMAICETATSWRAIQIATATAAGVQAAAP